MKRGEDPNIFSRDPMKKFQKQKEKFVVVFIDFIP